jgi:hypothetical protein
MSEQPITKPNHEPICRRVRQGLDGPPERENEARKAELQEIIDQGTQPHEGMAELLRGSTRRLSRPYVAEIIAPKRRYRRSR